MPHKLMTREEAVRWAKANGICWYATKCASWSSIFVVTDEDSSCSEETEDKLVTTGTLNIDQTAQILEALNGAFAFGRLFERSGGNKVKDLSPTERLKILSGQLESVSQQIQETTTQL